MERLSFEKIFYHRRHLDDVLGRPERAFPIHLELGLTNFCNHDCAFCYAAQSKFSAESGRRRTEIPAERLFAIVQEMREWGLLSVNMVGSGEGMLHSDFVAIVERIRRMGVELGIFTNGSNVKGAVARAIVDNLTFVRFSLTGATTKVHKKAQGVGGFYGVLANIDDLVRLRGGKKTPTIGIQFILTDYSAGDLFRAIEIAGDLGVDYFQIKPVFPQRGRDGCDNGLELDNALQLVNRAKELQNERLKIYIKPEQMRIVSENITDRCYRKCLGSCTTTVLEADLNLYVCSNQKVAEFCLGNLGERSFEELWLSQERRRLLAGIDVNNCPAACRMDPLNIIYDKINKGQLAIPDQLPEPTVGSHVNFL